MRIKHLEGIVFIVAGVLLCMLALGIVTTAKILLLIPAALLVIRGLKMVG